MTVTPHDRRTLVPFLVKHRPWFVAGAAAAVAVIALRLALPWAVKGLIRPWNHGETDLEPAFFAGTLALILAVGLGLADHLVRLWFGRFAVGVSRDLRQLACARVLAGSPRNQPGATLNALLADTNRLKSGLRTFLVHTLTSVGLCVGLVVTLLCLEPLVGLIFLVGSSAVLAHTASGTRNIYRRAKQLRKREGRLAERVHAALLGEDHLDLDRLARPDGRYAMSLTRATGRATWNAHAVFGGGVLLSMLWLAHRLAQGADGSHLVTVVLYALMLRSPLVRLVRQCARAGKTLASARRLVRLCEDPAPSEPLIVPVPMVRGGEPSSNPLVWN